MESIELLQETLVYQLGYVGPRFFVRPLYAVPVYKCVLSLSYIFHLISTHFGILDTSLYSYIPPSTDINMENFSSPVVEPILNYTYQIVKNLIYRLSLDGPM